MKNFITHTKSISGKRSEENGSMNQDSVKYFEDDELLIVIVNDGCTNCDYPQKACEINTQVAMNIAKEQCIFEIPEKKFKELIINFYCESFDEARFPINELCATTAFVIIKKDTMQFIAFSVGDSAIMSFNEDMKCSMLLEPVNGPTSRITCFTNDEKAVKKLSQYKKGMITSEKYAGFILYTDGAESVSINPNDHGCQAQKLLKACYASDAEYAEEEKKVFGSLKKQTRDDITIAIIASNNDKISKKITNEVTIEDNPVKKENTENPDIISKSDLIRFLQTPRTVYEIADSGIISEKEIVPALVLLLKIGIISWYNNKFQIRK